MHDFLLVRPLRGHFSKGGAFGKRDCASGLLARSLSPRMWAPAPEANKQMVRSTKIKLDRVISTGQLRMLPYFHLQPINVVVFHGSQGISGFEGGFPLRCFQRLSRPYLATLQCHGRDNRSTRGTSTPVLSY